MLILVTTPYLNTISRDPLVPQLVSLRCALLDPLCQAVPKQASVLEPPIIIELGLGTRLDGLPLGLVIFK